ncbi:ATP-grasp domain-containing protein [uncultured Treponema sp.]|uniref:ATP-grasp domain-containing protein n=1 Tax=uncultured Treponema sp. TaxID=162155 RepID=UPI0025983EF7|nr:ATP-grasp domain-containing protein [uncultured Treponema sp.]
MESVMILGAGPLQVPAIKKAKEFGMKVYCCDYDKDAVGFLLCDVPLVISTLDQDAVLQAAKKYNVDYVITSTSDAPVRTVAYVNEKLGKPLDISYEDAVCATVKSAMRERLGKFGVPIPRYFVCKNFKDFSDAVKAINGNCVVKPSDSAASRGVELFNSNHSEDEYKKQYEYSKSFSRNGIVMVEEFMHGPEVSVECMVVNRQVDIIAITDKLVTPLPYFVELGHSEQSQLPEETKNAIKKVATDAIHAIGIVNGCSHTEIKITEDGPKIVEIAARLGGDFITSKLVPLSTGVDMVGNTLALALHKPIDLTRTKNCGSAIRFFGGKEGTLKEIIINGKPQEIPGVREIEFYVKPGDIVHELHSSNDRLGYVITEGKTAQQAIVCAETVLNMVEFVIS